VELLDIANSAFPTVPKAIYTNHGELVKQSDLKLIAEKGGRVIMKSRPLNLRRDRFFNMIASTKSAAKIEEQNKLIIANEKKFKRFKRILRGITVLILVLIFAMCFLASKLTGRELEFWVGVFASTPLFAIDKIYALVKYMEKYVERRKEKKQ